MDATIIYPHQLFKDSPAVKDGRPIYLVEEPLLLTHNPIHRQKLILHKLSLDAYERELTQAGHKVTRLTIGEHTKTADVFARLQRDGVERMHIIDTTDDYLERAIERSGLERAWYDSPLFLLPKAEAVERFQDSNRFMARFYKQLRKDRDILMDAKGEPAGGKWSFDSENRESLPRDVDLPEDIRHFGNKETKAAEKWAQGVSAEQYGEAGCWLPYTHAGAVEFLQEFLQEFLRARFANFGPYEDAMTTAGTRLWHSTLSPLLNIGLLTPQQVLDAALAHTDKTHVPLNSLEGFVRQILGWREFMRASYEADGRSMRRRNFFHHERELPAGFWTAKTGVDPVDHVITTALTHGYTHHIERLMVMGNFMLLSQLHPTEVYRWFMGMYLDAYDWVMIPNVYGMSQFADGGSFATKPYISGANYIKNMGDFERGDWEAVWTALYWHFVDTHSEFFASNHRLGMMPRTLARMKHETREEHKRIANAYLANE